MDTPHSDLKAAQGIVEGTIARDIVVISLPWRTDRRSRLRTMMSEMGLGFRFVDGVRLEFSDIDPVEYSRIEWMPEKSAAGRESFISGNIGCKRAHIQCLEEALRSGMETVLIMEDDVVLAEDWYARFILAKNELPPLWYQLYFGARLFAEPIRVGPHLVRLTAAYQTTAILYSRAGIEATLKCLRSARSEVDTWITEELHPLGNSYCVYPAIAWQAEGFSDIRSRIRPVVR